MKKLTLILAASALVAGPAFAAKPEAKPEMRSSEQTRPQPAKPETKPEAAKPKDEPDTTRARPEAHPCM